MFASQITPLHVERGRQMATIVAHDITERGLSFEAAVESLADFLGIEVDSVKLGIAIANEARDPSAALRRHNAEVSRHYASLR